MTLDKIFNRHKPYIIAITPHYDDKKNIKKCYNKHLARLCDRVIILYGRVENYPAITKEEELKEQELIKQQCDKSKISTIFNKGTKTFEDKRQMLKILHHEAFKEMESVLKGTNLTRKIPNHTPIWMLRIDSDEEMTKELADELEILTQLDYLYTIFLKEKHFVNEDNIIIGSKGWDIKGNKFIPRVMKMWDGQDIIKPMTPHHHSTTYAYLYKFQKVVPYNTLPSITTVESLIHWGHAKIKRTMNRKSKFYENRGDMNVVSKDNYVPINTPDEKRLRTWFKNKEFEGIMPLERRRKT